MGVFPVFFWTLTLVTTIKYVWIVLRADNHGEGGVFSLYNLVKKHSPKWTIYLAMLGCAALLADGMITPAITITSAIEGLTILSPGIPVIPIVIGMGTDIAGDNATIWIAILGIKEYCLI